MDDIVLAGDLGGTNLRMAVVDGAGKLIHRVEAETPRHINALRIVELVGSLASECRAITGTDPKSLVFAIPGPIHAEKGEIFNVPNLPELRGSDLVGRLAEELGMKVILENDATAAAMGERWLGASKGFDSSICITLGTGVGGGIIIDGKPLRGPDGTAGEIGHVCVEPLGPPCGCGSNGCLEQFSSATAIVRMANELTKEYPESEIRRMSEFDSADVFRLGKRGDALCIEVFRRAGAYLGIALAGLINVLNPEAIVIGGGAAEGWELFIDATKAEIKKRAFREPAERAKIVRASLGNDAGIVGAAYLAFQKGGHGCQPKT